jgi:hypothetical protein
MMTLVHKLALLVEEQIGLLEEIQLLERVAVLLEVFQDAVRLRVVSQVGA